MKREIFVGFLPFYLLVVILFLAVAHGGSRVITALNENAELSDGTVVIIDAGHGGIDGGATSCTGVLESHINLEIAFRLEAIMQFMGYETRMIRTTDTSIYTQGDTIAAQKISDLKERVRIVNETQQGILISIHQNTFSDRKYWGAQVFYADCEDSRELAVTLQKNLVSTINPGSKRTAKKAKGVYLMEHMEKPGVLLECGFLSNPHEEALLRSQEYQKKLCAVIAATVCTYAAT